MSTKIKNIEFLRIIGCIAIILLHLYNNACLGGIFPDINLYSRFHTMTYNGQKAVDLFFILSGFFFALKFDVTKSLWSFIKSKLIRLYPVLIFTIILYFLSSLTGAVEFHYYENIFALFCLEGTSLVLKIGNVGVFWYVSAMMWTFVLYFYMCKNYAKKNVDLIIAGIIFFCYSFLIHAKGGKINSHTQTFYYIFNVGMMRALAGIGVGYFIAEWYKNNIDNIENLILSFKCKVFITVLEFMCVYFIINNLMLRNLKFKNDVIYIITFAMIVVLFLVKQGVISKVLENNFWVTLSKYTYSLYMTHVVVLSIMKGSFWKYNAAFVYAHPVGNIFITLSLVFVLGIFTYHFVEFPVAKYLKEKAQNPCGCRERERERERESIPSI